MSEEEIVYCVPSPFYCGQAVNKVVKSLGSDAPWCDLFDAAIENLERFHWEDGDCDIVEERVGTSLSKLVR